MAAAYAALVSLSHVLHQILHPPPTHHFIIPTQLIESLLEQVSSLIHFLEKYSSKPTQEIEDVEKRIVDAAHEAEDIVESDVVSQIQAIYAAHHGEELSSTEEIKDSSLPIQKGLEKKEMHQDLPKVIDDFTSINKDAAEIKTSEVTAGIIIETTAGASSLTSLPSGNDIMVGFDEHLNQIKGTLGSDEPDVQVVPVVGMGGIGKTTLATNVFMDAYVIEHFEIRAWVSVSPKYMAREIILELLQQTNREKYSKEVDESAADLGTLLYQELFGKRYLIVLDDVWDIEAWFILKRSFPNNKKGSRILVTTRLLNLAKDFESCSPYQMDILNKESSWKLLLDKVVGKEGSCPDDLKEIGKSIARRCGGLPLALVVIGGLLAKSEKTKEFWKYVEENITSAANSNNDENWTKILSLSYHELPVHLKPCFLYLIVFPKKFEIRTSQLIRLWVAEGFIKACSGKSLEEVAEVHLKDLLDRNLVIVSKQGNTGKVKNCRIHDLIRDMCRREAQKSQQKQSKRRLCIHKGTTKEKVAKRLSSLRVLDVRYSINEIERYAIDEIERLFNLRYIDCSLRRDQLHVLSFISLHWNLQTLVYPAPISLPSEFWKMSQLRHLKVPGITLSNPQQVNVESESVTVLEHLQTLSTVKDFAFRESTLRRIPNVRKLGIDCDTTNEVEPFCLHNLVLLDKLESLDLAFRGTWQKMNFPHSLEKLTLSHCEIPWEDMYVVGSLPKLEVLKLQTRAAQGKMWNPNEGEFCRLKLLLINQCELEILGADESHFPCLEHLQLIGMRMEEIPMDFAKITTLHTIDINYCRRSLSASAKRMSMARDYHGNKDVQVRSTHSEDAAVESLLQNLKRLIDDQHPNLMKCKGGIFFQILFKFFQLVKAGEVETDLGNIRSLIDKTQDIIDYVSTAKNNSSLRVKIQYNSPQKLSRLLKKINVIYGDTDRINYDFANLKVDDRQLQINYDFANLKVDDRQLQEYVVAGIRETNMVGFEDEVEILKEYLCAESLELDVVCIIGMPGLGKTTLARKIFCDPQIKDEFPTRIWVRVSQEFTMKHMFHAILKEFTTIPSDVMNSKTDGELGELIVGYLENATFLVVMDDIRSCEDWDKLHMALPKSNKKGKVLITSRQEEVGRHVRSRREPHMLRFLNEDESYLLLQMEVFEEPMFPPELEDEAKLITDACNGLPLAIVVVAGTLVNRFSGDMTAMQKYWENISKSFEIYDEDDDPRKCLEKIILWSYEKLPDHLRECFLYFGMFPEKFEIPVWKLIRLWIAEGFIQQNGVSSLEETAENYLEELITRNLVKAEKFKLNGKPKTCLIHGMLRDLCLKEAGSKGNDFLQEIKMSSHGGFQPPISMKFESRRLCIHSNILKFIKGKPSGPNVRTFVCLSRDEMIVPKKNEQSIPRGFKLLRVLDVQPIRFNTFPTGMGRLVNLTYLVISVNLEVLPPSLSRLENIQTLAIDTNSRTLDTEEHITNMLQLRHFKTNASATLHTTSKSKKRGGEKIQTLGAIAPQSCNEDIFDMACTLKKLGIRGNLALLFDNKSGAFDSLRKLVYLEKLKLVHDVFLLPPPEVQRCRFRSEYIFRFRKLRGFPANESAPSEVQLRLLPPANKFPPRLTTLTLSETSLDWCHMSILGSLEHLEVLKLKDNAFQGEIWDATDGGFRRLKVLYIGRTNLKIWLASDYSFCRLKHLQLNNCEDLHQLPIELADVPSFEMLDLFRSKLAAASAKEIEAKIEKDNLQPGNVVRRFKLSIFLHEK